jgi:hypothetical protein
MPSRTIEESIAIRKWIEAALRGGAESPRAVKEFIEQNASDLTPPPSIPTIGNIMKDMGYKPTSIKWKKGKIS